MSSKAKGGTQHAFDFLNAGAEEIPPVVALFGDESFLKRLVRAKLRAILLGGDPDAPYATYDGEAAQWCDVADELSMVSLFGAGRRRMVVVEEADDFVTRCRGSLEEYVAHPRRTGVLVLVVSSWVATTRLYKAIDASGLQIDCRLPQKKSTGSKTDVDTGRLAAWLMARARDAHRMTLDQAAARLLWELAGPDLGVIDQDLAKLALFAGDKGKVTPQLVQDVVGGWRVKTIWEVVEAAAGGDAAEALRQLDHVLHAGDHPLAVFGPVSWALRRFTVATRIYQRAERRREKMSLRDALLQAGFRTFPPDALPKAEGALSQLGRDRAGSLLRWLLEADLALKGTHSSESRGRHVLEMLFLRMAQRGARPLAPASGRK